MIFFYPRTGLPQDIDSEFLKAVDIKSSSFRRPPLSMSVWLLNRSDSLVKKTAVLNSHWVILSAEAYAVIYDLARIVDTALPKVANLEEAFKTVLRSCSENPCTVTPQKVVDAADTSESQKLTKNSRKLILELLNRNRGNTKLNDPWGLSRAILRMEKTISDAKEKQKYKALVKDIPFTKYILLHADSSQSRPNSREAVDGFLARHLACKTKPICRVANGAEQCSQCGSRI